MVSSSNLVIFDVCNTLYDSNTTFDFIRFVVSRRLKGKQFYLNLLTFKYSPFFVGWTILAKLQKRDLVREKAVQLLAGLKKEEILQLARSFYEEQLEEKKMESEIGMLEEAKKSNEVWLFSNSLDPIIRVIAEKLQVRYEATELEYDQDEVFTGRISRDLSGKKKDIFEQRFGKGAKIKMMCSDNKSDHDILKLAETPYVVIYSPTHKKFWQKLNPTFIEKY